MNILVINAGSSSLKYQLINMQDEGLMANGTCERIGSKDSFIRHKVNGEEERHEIVFEDHEDALREVVELLVDGEHPVIKTMDEIGALGHRVVQGGEAFSESVLVTEDNMEKLAPYDELAPLHNPAQILAIRTCFEIFGTEIPQVMVFDTAFHQTIPEKAYTFPIPYDLAKKYSIRRYGFHGTSHRFVTARLAELVGKPVEELKIVTCHLGNGSSIAAVDGGKVVDTSMGFTPLDGLIMGTRSGSIDPSIIPFVMEKENMTPQAMSDLLNKESGYLGVSGISADDRDLLDAASNGNSRAKLALDIQHYEIAKYIGSYAAAMNGLDYIVFTGGIGENSDIVRENVCKNFEFLGLEFDYERNDGMRQTEAALHTEKSKVGVYVIPTNEELLIARDTYAITKNM